ncbi:hypothetical protein DFAR_1100006 [Desulfarculales bacterium]
MAQALSKMDLGRVKAVTLDETASKRGHSYITVFIDLDRKQKPVIIFFITPGKGYLVLFRRFLREHGGDHNNIAEVACDMSTTFQAVIGKSCPGVNVTQKGHLCTSRPVAHHLLHPPCPEVHSA